MSEVSVSESDLAMWVVYDHPKDFPDQYVARQHVVGIAGNRPTGRTMGSDRLERVRAALENLGLVCIARSEKDDPVIIETWL